jgi:hypothetical protein
VVLDAPHNERDRADHLVTDEHAGYLVTIKANLSWRVAGGSFPLPLSQNRT